MSRRDTREARNWYGACHRAAQEIGGPQKEAKVIMSLANVADRENEHELSLTYCRRAVTLLRDSADLRNLASALSVTGSVLINLRRAPEALVCLEEAAAIGRDLGDSSLELDALTLLAGVLQDLENDSDVLAVRRRITEINNRRPSKIGNGGKPNE
jgi:tetratricopeptide (TPR) repeat protein